ncbi:MAG: Hint domain-containing protein [Chitinophagaceae bacterium]
MNRKIVSTWLLSIAVILAMAQTPQGLTMEQYQKAKTFIIKDLDNITYAKFDNNTYVLDRYEGKKPYFITGDDGMKKRVDLYTLFAKADGSTLGTMIYYTNEKGKQYVACLPNISADGKVWEKYFEDIHEIDKEEKLFVLKLSYLLSKEYSYQQYKSSLKGKEIDRSEAGTYGNDICFPGDEEVAMADGNKKLLSDIKTGDKVISVDPVTRQPAIVTVKSLTVHEAKNYAITQLILVHAKEQLTAGALEVELFTRQLEATPNHPVTTTTGVKSIGSVKAGEEVLCRNTKTGKYEVFTVWDKTEKAMGIQKVYNIDADAGSTFIINGVMVMQKQINK